MQGAVEARRRIIVLGTVQGVGFRPFVYRLANSHCLSGFVRNESGAVEIEVQGSAGNIEAFLSDLLSQAPPLASITEISTEGLSPCAEVASGGFAIERSASVGTSYKLVPPDTATCYECLNELFDRNNRRFRYPFINCTNCGPRFTIITSLPYDRQATTMKGFTMCGECQNEYDNPSSRRFHAEPNACADCGPQLRWEDESGNVLFNEEALREAITKLKQRETIAIKGLGGFHLVCDATSQPAVHSLRAKKARERKPFALLLADVSMARSYCNLSSEEELELLHASRPIVLLRRRKSVNLADDLAPGLQQLGVMLPATPLQHLIMSDFGAPLVATSGNLSEEPIATGNDEARRRLSHLVSGFLDNDRDISSRYDDSVVQFVDGKKVVIRRSRGLTPEIIQLPFTANRSVLACGAHLKNTFCLVRANRAYVSQHVGDLENIESHKHFEDTLDSFIKLFDLDFDLIAHDQHPDYLSTSIARALADAENLACIPVQHHQAHIASCMAENGIVGKVIGIAFDGIGYGEDETLWGGEFFLSSLGEFTRVAHFDSVPLPGGAAGIKAPWRMALSYVLTNVDSLHVFEPFLSSLKKKYGENAYRLISRQIENRINSPLTSSCGRLFDAVSALLDICQIADYEGQAAMELEAKASEYIESHTAGNCSNSWTSTLDVPCFELELDRSVLKIKSGDLVKSLYLGFLSGKSTGQLAAEFHCAVANLILEVSRRLRQSSGINSVVLCGGVFQNKLLLGLAMRALSEDRFEVFVPSKLPPNDGGVSLGQAVVALARSGAIDKFQMEGY